MNLNKPVVPFPARSSRLRTTRTYSVQINVPISINAYADTSLFSHSLRLVPQGVNRPAPAPYNCISSPCQPRSRAAPVSVSQAPLVESPLTRHQCAANGKPGSIRHSPASCQASRRILIETRLGLATTKHYHGSIGKLGTQPVTLRSYPMVH